MTASSDLEDRGWAKLPFDAELVNWIDAARPLVNAILHDPAHAQWHRYAGTWFAGVHALPNDESGTLQGLPFPQRLAETIQAATGLATIAWDQAQVSVCFPGYPQPSPDESETAHRFRLTRDAAHVDGLHGEGPSRRRHLREHHQFILGLPVDPVSTGMSPFVVWEGSHHIVRAMFEKAFAGIAPAAWGDLDLTETYQQTRRDIFQTCRRVEIIAQPGEAYLAHRFTLHGMAPWTAPTSSVPRRAILYFRPETDAALDWLKLS